MGGVPKLSGLIPAMVRVVIGLARRAGAVGEDRAAADRACMLGRAALAPAGVGLGVLAV